MLKTRVWECTNEGRDKGKMFFIREMNALRAEKWAARALVALFGKQADIPSEIMKEGTMGILRVGLQILASANINELEPLMDEMLGQVQFIPDPTRPNIMRPLNLNTPNGSDDIMEIATLPLLRMQILDLQLGFSISDLT